MPATADNSHNAYVFERGVTMPLPDKTEEQAHAEEELLTRLVALNAERSREEQRGTVRWLQPEFQNRAGTTTQQTEQIALVPEEETETVAPVVASKHAWPKALDTLVSLEQSRQLKDGRYVAL